MTSDLVSVVIPTYNHAVYLVEAINSALAQTYPSVEIIVVDGGSTDNTRDVLQPYRDKIHYIYQENQGLAFSRNTGIEAASGRWVALLDADDLWHADKLRIQVEYLNNHPDVGLVGTGRIASESFAGWPPVDLAKVMEERHVSIEDIFFSHSFPPSSVLIPRSVFDEVGCFDKRLRYVEDVEMWARISTRFRIVCLPAPLCWYRITGNNMHTVPEPTEHYSEQVVRKCFSEIPSLRKRFLLRQMIFSLYKGMSAARYARAGRRLTASRRLLRAFISWPLPYPQRFPQYKLYRTKTLAKLVLPGWFWQRLGRGKSRR